jgi:hypothetical protein
MKCEIATMSAAEYQNFLSRRAVTEYGQVFKSFHAFVVSNLLDIYTRSTNQERQQILEEVAHRPFALNALWSLLEEYRWRLQNLPLGNIHRYSEHYCCLQFYPRSTWINRRQR